MRRTACRETEERPQRKKRKRDLWWPQQGGVVKVAWQSVSGAGLSPILPPGGGLSKARFPPGLWGATSTGMQLPKQLAPSSRLPRHLSAALRRGLEDGEPPTLTRTPPCHGICTLLPRTRNWENHMSQLTDSVCL